MFRTNVAHSEVILEKNQICSDVCLPWEGKAMIGEVPLTQLPLADILFLVRNSAFYFGLGFLAFKLFENVARGRGLLGHY